MKIRLFGLFCFIISLTTAQVKIDLSKKTKFSIKDTLEISFDLTELTQTYSDNDIFGNDQSNFKIRLDVGGEGRRIEFDLERSELEGNWKSKEIMIDLKERLIQSTGQGYIDLVQSSEDPYLFKYKSPSSMADLFGIVAPEYLEYLSISTEYINTNLNGDDTGNKVSNSESIVIEEGSFFQILPFDQTVVPKEQLMYVSAPIKNNLTELIEELNNDLLYNDDRFYQGSYPAWSQLIDIDGDGKQELLARIYNYYLGYDYDRVLNDEEKSKLISRIAAFDIEKINDSIVYRLNWMYDEKSEGTNLHAIDFDSDSDMDILTVPDVFHGTDYNKPKFYGDIFLRPNGLYINEGNGQVAIDSLNLIPAVKPGNFVQLDLDNELEILYARKQEEDNEFDLIIQELLNGEYSEEVTSYDFNYLTEGVGSIQMYDVNQDGYRDILIFASSSDFTGETSQMTLNDTRTCHFIAIYSDQGVITPSAENIEVIYEFQTPIMLGWEGDPMHFIELNDQKLILLNLIRGGDLFGEKVGDLPTSVLKAFKVENSQVTDVTSEVFPNDLDKSYFSLPNQPKIVDVNSDGLEDICWSTSEWTLGADLNYNIPIILNNGSYFEPRFFANRSYSGFNEMTDIDADGNIDASTSFYNVQQLGFESKWKEVFTWYELIMDDRDLDGIIDGVDNAPDNYNPDQRDFDNDGIGDENDNCPYIYNPNQEDLDNDGVGDVCTWSDTLYDDSISVLETTTTGSTIETDKLLSTEQLANYELDVSSHSEFLELNSSNQLILKKSLSESSSDLLKIPVVLSSLDRETIKQDTLELRVLRKLTWEANKATPQNGYVPYYYYSKTRGAIGHEESIVGPEQFFPMGNQKTFNITDLDGDGLLDIVGQKHQVWSSRKDSRYNILRNGYPAYLNFNEDWSISYYNEDKEKPDQLFHNADLFVLEDFDGDGEKELITLGEHYHSAFIDAPEGEEKTLAKNVFKDLGYLENKDYNDWGAKLIRYYTNDNGRYIDRTNFKVDNRSEGGDPFVSVFGHATGDIDNDGDIDLVLSVQTSHGRNLNVLTNDGEGNLKGAYYSEDQYGYSTGPEGPNLLIDITGDGNLDYFFSGVIGNNDPGKIGYLIGNGDGTFDLANAVFIEELSSDYGLAAKDIYNTDLDNDGTNEIIIYRSTGFGADHLVGDDSAFSNEILVLKVSNGSLTNVTTDFIPENSTSRMTAAASTLEYQDFDGDGVKDLVPVFFADPVFTEWQNSNGWGSGSFNGYWDAEFDGLVYLKFENGQFITKEVGQFNYTDEIPFYNSTEQSTNIGAKFFIRDINGDGVAEIIHHPFIGINLIVFVKDQVKPTIQLKENFTIDLGEDKVLELTFEDIDDGSFDDVLLDSSMLSRNNFDCSSIGEQTIEVKLIDHAGNESIQNFTFTITGDYCDSDEDGVLNKDDLCPNSQEGSIIDAAGCEVFALPSNTFSVSVTSATCPDSSNGSITISSSNTDYSYRYAIDDQAPQVLTDNTQTISNLSAGIYTICVTVDGVSDYQRCYTIEITEPAPLVASSRIDVSTRNLQLDLSGSEEYQVTLNGKTFLTSEDKLSLNLQPGMNRVEVATALDCQGVYFEEIFVSEEVKVYPNPTPGPLQLFVAGSDKEVTLSITSLSGSIIKKETLSVPANRIIETTLGNVSEGLYLITLNGTTVKTTHKVIKE